ncbi:MAG TPA: transglutaminase-like domain-containing protein [Gemmatimonadales bacterium]|nr:transglutaminase-like domain-containing protein [Gemmatimonadales bacterium]
MIRRLVAVLILGSFGLSLALLTRRTMHAALADEATIETLPVSPGSAYYTLRLEGALVGFATITVDTSVTTVRVSEFVDVRLPDGDSIRRYQVRGETLLDRGLRLRSFDYVRTVDRQRSLVRGRALLDTLVVWQVGDSTRMPAADTVRLPASGLQTAGVMPLALVYRSQVRVGTRRASPVADPFARRVASGELLVLADSTFVLADSARQDDTQQWVAARWDSVHAWQVERRGVGAPSRIWVDDAGLPVAGELWAGLELERQPYEMVTASVRAATAARWPDLPRTAGSHRLTARARTLRRLEVKLTDVMRDTAAWHRSGLAGGPQHLRGDTLVVDLGADSSRLVPEPPLRDGLVPADDPSVRAYARRLTAGETAPTRIVARLAAWTARNVAPADEREFPDARQALGRGRGDAGSRAALFTAMARSAGVPTRAVAGLVADGGSWRRHAWAEAWLDGRWTPVDPSLGVVPASAAYVRLLEDAPADPMILIPLASRLAPAALPRQAIP